MFLGPKTINLSKCFCQAILTFEKELEVLLLSLPMPTYPVISSWVAWLWIPGSFTSLSLDTWLFMACFLSLKMGNKFSDTLNKKKAMMAQYRRASFSHHTWLKSELQPRNLSYLSPILKILFPFLFMSLHLVQSWDQSCGHMSMTFSEILTCLPVLKEPVNKDQEAWINRISVSQSERRLQEREFAFPECYLVSHCPVGFTKSVLLEDQ